MASLSSGCLGNRTLLNASGSGERARAVQRRCSSVQQQPRQQRKPRCRTARIAAACTLDNQWPSAPACCTRHRRRHLQQRLIIAARAGPEPSSSSGRADAAADADADAALSAGAVLLRATLPCGELTVRLMTEADVRGAGVLLTRAFGGTPEAVGLDEAM